MDNLELHNQMIQYLKNSIEHTVKLSCRAETSDRNMVTVEPPTCHQEFGHINGGRIKALLFKIRKKWLTRCPPQTVVV